MKAAVKTLAELGADVVLAPERWISDAGGGEGVPLAELVVLRNERGDGLVLDTTHAKDGLLDIASARRTPASARSTKKAVRPGDVIVSRLRPYLRQIAYVHPLAAGEGPLVVSSEFYVLAPRDPASIAFLVPFLLSARVQAILAAAQEGGHHPRGPRASLMALRVPSAVVAERANTSRAVQKTLDALYRAEARWQALL